MWVKRTPYVKDWNTNRQAEIKELTSKGILPHYHELEQHPEKTVEGSRWPLGSVAAIRICWLGILFWKRPTYNTQLINEVLPAKVGWGVTRTRLTDLSAFSGDC
ncbi:putative nitronate monooxygenase [Mycena venus]|uniref:Putative nitronate monooxygenase n=1 Tax=Mycena venus TaxID=2733690 RepID=A0A8H7D2A3_9AGAR|nr:putative nitronate monooxygenase [Mycena venus]